MTGDDEEEITEEIVDGIFIEHQYKIENIPGYAEAAKQASKCMRKIFDGEELTDQEHEELDRAMGELMMLEIAHRYGIKR
jgi:hypothetical protein